ncbi:5,6-dimethylbenzimidazole synthase [Tumebacillus permanentifrigoris]|uniref:Cob(II)yrinic acid a,c-diamide reductase n=1 Tax=Tumebacillus permanentifrigoris TaxID=378543 RepID=A0A316DC20_9BACL|nr:5,6-dimethylbenzimidazole synthase [Tumebacillus permanentifrigoris]PWK14837.1 cob(II)yrinic acid a,c-diamide reductase [Tumebacillus permanentifrigoris]
MNFTNEQRDAVYEAIHNRRDIRKFLPTPLEAEKVERILLAGHHAPSVGFMQPWDFILVRAQDRKDRLALAADRERQALAIHFAAEGRDDKFLQLKVEGLREAPLTVCITCDPTRGGDHVLGRNSIPETDILSVACAIQNMWLAAYAEGIAMGWVSFYKKPDVRRILEIPPHIEPVALLSFGYTDHYPKRPILEESGWAQRQCFESLLHNDTWNNR